MIFKIEMILMVIVAFLIGYVLSYIIKYKIKYKIIEGQRDPSTEFGGDHTYYQDEHVELQSWN